MANKKEDLLVPESEQEREMLKVDLRWLSNYCLLLSAFPFELLKVRVSK